MEKHHLWRHGEPTMTSKYHIAIPQKEDWPAFFPCLNPLCPDRGQGFQCKISNGLPEIISVVSGLCQSKYRHRYSKNLNDPAGVIMQEVYCPECRTKRDINNSEEEVMKNGRRVLKGRCASCNTPIIKVLNQKLKWHAVARWVSIIADFPDQPGTSKQTFRRHAAKSESGQ